MVSGLSEAARSRIADFCLIADLTGTDLLVLALSSGRFVACNDSAHTRLGYSRAELLTLPGRHHPGARLGDGVHR